MVRKARAASAPGPGVQRYLWNLLRVAWKNQVIPSEWRRAVTVFIPKETNSTTISQFRSIALLNVEGKIFFSILAKRLTTYLISNGTSTLAARRQARQASQGAWNTLQSYGSRSREQKEREVTCMWCGWILPMHTGPSRTNSSSMPWTSSTSCLHPCPGSQVL